MVEKLITLARKTRSDREAAAELFTSAERGSSEWKQWRDSDQWQQWAAAIAPDVAGRRRAFAALRDKEAVEILFDELAERFADRPGGYTRIVRLAERRLGDAGEQALIEFVGERDRSTPDRSAARKPLVVDDEPETAPADELAVADEQAVAEDESQGAETAEAADGEGDTEKS